MKVLVLGATGKVGRLAVAAALDRGHEVTAFVRDPSKLKLRHPKLTIFTGNALDPAQIKAAMMGHNAVISTLGHNSPKTGPVLTTATKAVLANLTPDQRFISLTGDGVGDPNDPKPGLGGRLVNAVVKILPGGVFADGKAHADLLRSSRTNWILVRSPRMTGSPATHNYRAGYLKIGFTTHATRSDVAAFMLDCLIEATWLQKAPIIASP